LENPRVLLSFLIQAPFDLPFDLPCKAKHKAKHMTLFTDLPLHPDLLPALDDLGFTQPTSVQELAIPPAIERDQDLIVLARTGTGKTAAFGLPLLTLAKPRKIPQGLILAPTRELANQIADDLRGFMKHYPSAYTITTIYGGTSIVNQIQRLNSGTSIIVATPGRLLDLYRRKVADLSQIEILILDEADEMLNMGFKDELDAIMSALPRSRRTWLFSATMPKGVRHIALEFMNNPLEIKVETLPEDQEREGKIEHIAYEVPYRRKYTALLRLVDATPNLYGIVFCRTRQNV
jgi:ATP-dependent RNA helicase DeaD